MKRCSLVVALALIISTLMANGCTGGVSHEPHLPKNPKVVTCEPGKWGGTLKMAISGIPLTFNPYLASSPDTYEITSKLYGTLLDYDYVTQKPGNDGLASSVDVLADNRTYVIHLREGLAFSNGKPLTADDVLFSLQIATSARIETIYGDLLRMDGELPKLTKDDALTLRVAFAEHYEPFKLLLCKLPIVSRDSLEDPFLKGTFKDAYNLDTPPEKIVSSGPFMLSSYRPDKQIEMKYNPYYWKADSNGTALPYADGITYYLKMSREEQGFNMLTKNEIHLARVLPKDLGQFSANPRFIAKNAGHSLATWQLILNWRTDKTKISNIKSTWFRTPGFRWAMSSVLDRNNLLKVALDGTGSPAYSYVATTNETWYNKNIKKYDYNVGAAKQFLAPLNFTLNEQGELKDVGKNTIRFDIIHTNEFVPNQIGGQLVEDFKKLGMIVESQPQDPKKFWALLNNGLFDVALVETSPMFADPAFLQPNYYKSGFFVWFYDKAESSSGLSGGSDKWMGQIMSTMNQALKKSSVQERQQSYFQVQEDWSKTAPVLYLVSEDVVVAAQTVLGNFKPATIEPCLTWNVEEFFIKN